MLATVAWCIWSLALLRGLATAAGAGSSGASGVRGRQAAGPLCARSYSLRCRSTSPIHSRFFSFLIERAMPSCSASSRTSPVASTSADDELSKRPPCARSYAALRLRWIGRAPQLRLELVELGLLRGRLLQRLGHERRRL
jgi:hypothetical protein